jgi:hypothetical protein
VPITSTTAADLALALSAYARRFHATVGNEHHVASPLGAWMLLALCATGSDGRLRDELTRILGADVDTAAAFAAALLSEPHPAVHLATGVWTSREIAAASAARWLARLPSAVDRGELPRPAALDAWADRHTHGMIRNFAADLDPSTMLILATVLATKVSWEAPFIPITAAHRGLVGSTMWSGNVERVLKTPESGSHDQFIAATERAGDVGVHTADAEEGMSVTSVIAERGVSPADVLATAYEIAAGRHVTKRSMFDLPLGNWPMWRITEQAIETTAPNGREEKYEAVLPAWRADASHDLDREELGFTAAAAALQPVLGLPDHRYDASQRAVAQYGRTGFRAAVLTAMRMTLGRAGPLRIRPGLLRVATLQFGHPYAVVAVTHDRQYGIAREQFGPWHGVPVYSAWVAEPCEADEEVSESPEVAAEQRRRALDRIRQSLHPRRRR